MDVMVTDEEGTVHLLPFEDLVGVHEDPPPAVGSSGTAGYTACRTASTVPSAPPAPGIRPLVDSEAVTVN